MNNQNKIELTMFNLFWLSYVFLPLFAQSSTCTATKALLIVCLAILLLFHKEKNKSPIVFGIILPFFIVLLSLQMIIFHNMEIIKQSLNIIIFFILCRYTNYPLQKKTSEFFRICTVMATIPVIIVCIKNGSFYFYRDMVFIEKQSLSAMFTVSCFYCLTSIFQNERIRLNLCILISLTIMNIFIIQSKTSILILVVNIATFFILDPDARRKIKRYIPHITTTYIILLIFFPNLALPDDIRYGINRLLGFDLLSSNYTRLIDRMSLTYDVRLDMRKFCFSLFEKNPLMGIGIGNFADANKFSSNYFNELSEPESSWLSIMTEGGLCYITTMLVFFGASIKKFRSMWLKNGKDLHYLAGALLFANFGILFFFNDFMDSIFWINSGLMMGGLINLESRQKKSSL